MTHPIVPHPHATKEQRRRVLTGTDVKRIAEGDWLALWEEKTGRTEPKDLTFIWKPRLGQATENLHGWWHGHTEGVLPERMPDQPCYNPKLDLPAHYAVTFDFWIPGDGVPLELKHLNARNNLRDAAETYMPQLQWQILVAGVTRLRFSCIFGNEDPVWGYVDRNEDYLKRLRLQADSFWQLVEQDIPPGEGSIDETLQELAKSVTINGLKDYDFSTQNEWVAKAADYVRLKPILDDAKTKCDTLSKELKDLVPADARVVTGGGIKIARNKAGNLTLTIPKAEELDA